MTSAQQIKQDNNSPQSPKKNNDSGFLGSGISLTAHSVILIIATFIFLYWGTPLWDTHRRDTHVMRLLGSYLSLIPLVVLALRQAKSFTYTRLISSLFLAASVKMQITAALFHFLSPGTATNLHPRKIDPFPLAAHRQSLGYRAATEKVDAHPLSTAVQLPSHTTSAIAYIKSPLPGISLDTLSVRHEQIIIKDNQFNHALYYVRPNDVLTMLNRDNVLHTLHLRNGTSGQSNRPLPPHDKNGLKAISMRIPQTGLYALSCDNHASERGWLLSVDSPYVTMLQKPKSGNWLISFDQVTINDEKPNEVTILSVVNGELMTKKIVFKEGQNQ